MPLKDATIEVWQKTHRSRDRARLEQTKSGGRVQEFSNAPSLSDTATRLVGRVTVEDL